MESIDKPVEASELDTPTLRDRQASPPPAWKPGVVWDGNEGEITSRPVDQPTPHWDDILKSWGYDPELYELIEPIKVSTWDTAVGDGQTKQLWSYKAGIKKRNPDEQVIPYDDLVAEIKNHRPSKKSEELGDSTFVVCLADWQIGKGDTDGSGLEDTIKRLLEMIDKVDNRIKELKKLGRKMDELLVLGIGDMIEGCSEFYSYQAFTVEANRRSQVRITRRLIRDAIVRWSKHFNRVVVSAVPGNHGENRRDGKNYTNAWDNDDVSVFECVAEIFSANPATYGHVEFRLPEREMSVMFDCHGVIVGAMHGHTAKSGTGAGGKIANWWKDQSFGMQPIGDARILITGHYHHLLLNEYGTRTHIQCPSEDGGSQYYTNSYGEHAPSGTLTLVVGESIGPNGFSDLQVV